MHYNLLPLIMLLAPTAVVMAVVAFAPVKPSRTKRVLRPTTIDTSEKHQLVGSKLRLNMMPFGGVDMVHAAVQHHLHDISNILLSQQSSSVVVTDHLASPSALESLLSTMYTATAKINYNYLAPAHGHSNPLFGPPDPILMDGQSIKPSIPIPVPDPKVELPPEAVKFLDSFEAKDVQDPRHMIRANGYHFPGFQKTRGFFPQPPRPLQASIPYDSVPDDITDLSPEFNAIFWMNGLSNLPVALFSAVAFDFFFVSANLNTYKDEIERNEDEVAIDWLAEGLTRGFFGLIIASVVFWLSTPAELAKIFAPF